MKEKIKKFIKNLKKSYDLCPFLYGRKNNDAVYYSSPYWDDDEIVAAIMTLLSGKWLVSGEEVMLFEKKFAKMHYQRYCVMVNSGSSANLVMIAALKKYFKWDNGDEIIVSVVGFPTTISVIVHNNLVPIFIDIELDTLNFDVELIESKITSKTKGILLSPSLGNPPNVDKLTNLCKKYNLKLILDNCDSLGSKWQQKLLSDYAIASSYSFYPSHHITTGEGGAVTSNNKDIVNTARQTAWWGRACFCVGTENLLSKGKCGHRFDKWLKNYDGIVDHRYVFNEMGYNLKPLDLQGAIGLEQLKKIKEINQKRNEHKSILEKIFLKYIDNIYIPKVFDKAEPIWFGLPIVCKDKGVKNKLVSYLEENKIQTRNFFAGNILLHPGYSHLDDFDKYPVANKVLERVFFVGVAPHYTNKTFSYIEGVLERFDKTL